MLNHDFVSSRRIPVLFLLVAGLAFPEAAVAQGARISETYGQRPLQFEANQGQTHKDVRFLSRGSGYSLYLTAAEAVLLLAQPGPSAKHDVLNTQAPPATETHGHATSVVLRMTLVGAASRAIVNGLEALPGKVNYFIGKDPTKWRTNIPTYAKVHYRDVYPGVDVLYYGNQRQLEYDFVVAPGADPKKIVLSFKGADRMEIDAQGDLVLRAAAGAIRQHKPVIYQEIDGIRQKIDGAYVLNGANRVGFKVATYDRSRPLIIDPVLAYATYLGGTADDGGWGIAVDVLGNAYVTGIASPGFPTTAGAFQTGLNNSCGFFSGCAGAFITKLDPTGTALYSTYLDGAQGFGIAVDGLGNAYVTGHVTPNPLNGSTNFPTTAGAFQPGFAGGTCTTGGYPVACTDAFVTKLDPTGSALIYSTFLGGTGIDRGRGIAVDAIGNAYVTGYTGSANFPITAGAFQTTYADEGRAGTFFDAFVTKLNPAGSALVYSTYLGGLNDNSGSGIAVDAAGNAYVTGHTGEGFPTTAGAFQTIYRGNGDAFVTKLDTTGSTLVYSTLLGGSGADGTSGIAIDILGNAYVTGATSRSSTANSNDFPTTAGAFQVTGVIDAFVTKLNPAGTGLVYSTYLGGSGNDSGSGIAVDVDGNAYVTGVTSATGSYDLPIFDFPTTAEPFERSSNGGACLGDHTLSNAFVTKLNPTGSGLTYSTYLGGSDYDEGRGIAVDGDGNAHVTGNTASNDFPTTAGAFQPTCRGGRQDAFVAKILASTRIEESGASYTGPWTTYGPETGTFSDGTLFASDVAGSIATFEFTGTSVSWIGVKCAICGIATVSIDGGPATTVNTIGPSWDHHRSERVYSASGLAANMSHTMTITVTGTTTSSGNYIAVDAIDVPTTKTALASTRTEESGASYTGPWTTYGPETGTFSKGTVVASDVAGAIATFEFTGTMVSWIGVKCAVCGIATVSIDGGPATTVNTTGPSWDRHRSELVYSASGLAANMSHTITITATGTTTSSGYYIAVDAIDVPK